MTTCRQGSNEAPSQEKTASDYCLASSGSSPDSMSKTIASLKTRPPLQNPLIACQETKKARQLSLTGLVFIETGCATRLSGGGGDRTRVPRHFHACLYVCSCPFKGFACSGPKQQGPWQTSPQHLFNFVRGRRGTKRSGFNNRLSALTG